MYTVYTSCWLSLLFFSFLFFLSPFFLSVLPYLWIGDGRFIFDYEIEINKCPSFSLFFSLSLSVFFLRVFEKVFFFFFFPFARLKLLSETFNSEKNLLVNFAARLGFEGLSRGEDKIQIIFLRRLWIEINRDVFSNAFVNGTHSLLMFL